MHGYLIFLLNLVNTVLGTSTDTQNHFFYKSEKGTLHLKYIFCSYICVNTQQYKLYRDEIIIAN